LVPKADPDPVVTLVIEQVHPDTRRLTLAAATARLNGHQVGDAPPVVVPGRFPPCEPCSWGWTPLGSMLHVG
jgi:hypothetical protein